MAGIEGYYARDGTWFDREYPRGCDLGGGIEELAFVTIDAVEFALELGGFLQHADDCIALLLGDVEDFARDFVVNLIRDLGLGDVAHAGCGDVAHEGCIGQWASKLESNRQFCLKWAMDV